MTVAKHLGIALAGLMVGLGTALAHSGAKPDEGRAATSADIAALRADFANSYGTLEPRLRAVENGFAGVHEYIEEQKRHDLERALQRHR